MTDELLKVVADLYPTGQPFRLKEDVNKGFLSINKILSSGTTDYFLKQYRSVLGEGKVREVHEVKKYFHAHDIPVILPIVNRNEQTYFSHDGRTYALFPCVSKRQIDRDKLTPAALKSLSEMLARIHKAGKQFNGVVEDEIKPWTREIFMRKYDAIKEKIDSIHVKSDFDKKALASLELKRGLIEKITKTIHDFTLHNFALIHGDFHDGNTFFDETSDDVVFVFDFEKAKRGPQAFELIRSISYMVLFPKFDDESIGKAVTFLKHYHAVCPISREALREGLELWYIKIAYSLWIEGEHYLDDNHRPDVFFDGDSRTLDFFLNKQDVLYDKLASVLK